jgi:uncharacterized delta-60 repeat protein
MNQRVRLLLLAGLLSTASAAHSQTLDPAFQPTVAYRNQTQPGRVRAICQQADGRLLVAGDFMLMNGWPTSNVARLWPDGRVDTTFSAPAFVGGDVLALAADAQGRVVVSGTFGVVGGQPRAGVARLLADGSLDLTFRPDIRSAFSGGSGPIVRAVVVQPDGKVLLGGSFMAAGIGGAVLPHLVRLLPTGLPDAGFVPAMPFSGQVGALLLQPSGAILVAGNIYSNQLELVRRLLPNGSLDPSFTIVPANQVLAGIGQAMASTATGGFVLVGTYHGVGAIGRASVARFLADGTLDPAFNSPLPGGVGPAAPVAAVAVDAGGQVFIGGDLSNGGAASYLRRLLPNGAFDNTYFNPFTAPEPDAVVAALLLQPDGKLLVGGNFETIAGRQRSGLARLLPPGILATGRPEVAAGVQAYPVPAHDQLHLRLEAARLPCQVQLLDAIGRLVHTRSVSQADLTLPTNGLPAGSYCLRVRYSQGDVVTRRVVLE